jgi:hypothetical protein
LKQCEGVYHILDRYELLERGHPALRVDLRDALCDDIGLEASDGVVQRAELTIRVGNANLIHVNYCHMAYSTSCQSFHDPAADSA